MGAAPPAPRAPDAIDAAAKTLSEAAYPFIKDGALAHAKAIGNVDAKGVLPLEDFVAINSALGHMIKSSGTSATMGTYDAFKGLVADNIPSYLMSTVNPSDAQAAYTALMSFKDVVKAR